MSKRTLLVTASIQDQADSASRTLASELLAHLKENGRVTEDVIERDLAKNDIAYVTAEHAQAFYTDPKERSAEQRQLLKQSDALLDELKLSRQLIIASPMYNFSVPASLKAWIDLVCRVGESFQYTANGPEGLLDIETAYIVVATGGAGVNSPVDYLVPYLTHICKFIGIKDVKVIAADKTASQREAAMKQAREQIQAL